MPADIADDALIAGRRRMLFEMATGTGKTLTIAMLMKRWFQAAAISRVLFLADRIELAKQAKETFDDYLRDYPATILFGGKNLSKAKSLSARWTQLRDSLGRVVSVTLILISSLRMASRLAQNPCLG